MSTTLTTQTERRDGIEILSVSGEIDLSTAPRLGLAVADAVADGVPLVLDLTGVSFLDSAGARVLALAERAGVAQGAPLLLVPSEFVSRVFEIAGLEPAFRLFPALGEAVEAARVFVVGGAGEGVAVPPAG